LQVTAGLLNQGLISGDSTPGTLLANCLLDLTAGTWQNLGQLTVSLGSASLLNLPTGFEPLQNFAHFSSAGLVHTVGSPLSVPSGFAVAGAASFSDPVFCQGAISASPSAAITLGNGLQLSGTGTVKLGNGNLTTSDGTSGISGGSLFSNNQYVAAGSFTQLSGTNSSSWITTGNSSGDSGTYVLNGGKMGTGNITVGNSGTGTFVQSGGTNNTGNLYLGYAASGSGSFTLSGGWLTGYPYIGYSGSGSFTQTGGTVGSDDVRVMKNLSLGYNSGSVGAYKLSGPAQLLAYSENVGGSGTGVFDHTGGTNSFWYINLSSLGSYNLSASGYVYSQSYETVGGLFTQTGGTNALGQYSGLSVGAGGAYHLSSGLLTSPLVSIATGGTIALTGGTLQVGGGECNNLTNQGVFSGGSGFLAAGASSILNFAPGTLVNTSSMSLSAGTGSLVLLPAGFDSATNLASYSNSGVTYVTGSTLTIPAGMSCNGTNNHSRLEIGDPVVCLGTLAIQSRYSGIEPGVDLNNGLIISGTGSAGSIRNLTVNDTASGMSGGSLSTYTHYVGNSGTGNFTQSGGTNRFIHSLFLGNKAGDRGSYSLTAGLLYAVTVNDGGGYSSEMVGNSGNGSFTQTGGTNQFTGYSGALYLGYNSSGSGSYALSGTGLLTVSTEYVGYSGAGTFSQTGGVNQVSSLMLGSNGGSGTYNFSGGTLALASLSKGTGSAAFNFGGGTLQAAAAMSSTLAMTLTGSGGDACVNTAGYSVTLASLLSGPGGLTKSGNGMLTLAGTNNYRGNTLVRSGTLTLAQPPGLQNSTLDTSGNGILSFGTLTAATLGGLTGPGALSLSNTASAAVALSVGNNNGNTTYAGILNDAGGLTKIGNGILLLTGANTYSGSTAINQGELMVNGSLVSAVTVNSGGTLAGMGSLSSVTVNAGGHLAPGNSPGKLLLSGSLSLLGGAVMDYELDTPLTSDEVLMSGGSLALNGQEFGDFNFTPLAGFGPGTYDLIDAGSITGSLGSGTSGTIGGYQANLAVQGNDVVLNVVPEPSTLVLMAVGAVTLLGLLRRRQNAPPAMSYQFFVSIVALLSLFTAVRNGRADTNYSDGGIHTISTVMPAGAVNVSNNTTVFILGTGAVAGTSSATGNGQYGLMGTSGAVINLQGGSVTGGRGPQYGGKGGQVDTGLLNIVSGSMTGGVGGPYGGPGLDYCMSYPGAMNMTGGTIAGGDATSAPSTGAHGGNGLMIGSGTVNIAGGNILGGTAVGSTDTGGHGGYGGIGMTVYNGSVSLQGANIRGGQGLGDPASGGRGGSGGVGVWVTGGTLNIQSGSIAAGTGTAGGLTAGSSGYALDVNNGVVNLLGGSVSGGLLYAAGGLVNISGGSLAAASGSTAFQLFGGTMNIYGSGFNSGFGALTATSGTITGTLADGSIISWKYYHGTGGTLNLLQAPLIALGNTINATIIAGGTATLGTTVSYSASASAPILNYSLAAAVRSGTATLGPVAAGTGFLAPNSAQSCTLSATSHNVGANVISLSASGQSAMNSPQTSMATLIVLDHAAAAFANGSGTLNLDIGTLPRDSGTQARQFQIKNLLATYRAGLDLDSVMEYSDSGGVFDTNAMPFTDLAPGATSGLFDLLLDTSQPGDFSGQYRFNLSDEKDLSGHAGQQTLVLNVTAEVVPEPSTLALLGVGAIGLLAYGWRRRPVFGHRSAFVAAFACVAMSAAAAKADVFNMPARQKSLEFVSVGDAGNVASNGGYGAVAKTYRMGKFDVTATQYCQFLNAVAKTDTYALYNPLMGSPGGAGKIGCGIVQSGTPGSYSFSVLADSGVPGQVGYANYANFPVNYVSWGDAARFCNWLNNGQPTTGIEDLSTTESGAYYLNGAVTESALNAVVRSPTATYWIPTRDEWFKAAYYRSGGTRAGYWSYPTMSAQAPSNLLSSTGTNNANYLLHVSNPDPQYIYTDPINYLTPVGAFAASPGPYGTYDMGGNVWQYTETLVNNGITRVTLGGSWQQYAVYMISTMYTGDGSTVEHSNLGFRVATIPEPPSLTLLLAAGMCAVGVWTRRRRKHHA
jgi:formylglycine-generating enzyme required for sulfatase activity